VVRQIFPVVGDLAALPHAAGSFRAGPLGRGQRAAGADAGKTQPALLLARWRGLPRRNVGSGRRFRPDWFGRSCRLRRSIEADGPCGEIIAPLKRLQDGFVGDQDRLLLHDPK